jgi:hypothetical protein
VLDWDGSEAPWISFTRTLTFVHVHVHATWQRVLTRHKDM